MVTRTKYLPDAEEFPQISPIDEHDIVVVGFNWQKWLDDIGETEVSQSAWTISSGGAIGDGITSVIKKTYNRTPPPPQISTNLTTAHIWVTTAKAGATLTVTNHVVAGTQVLDRSATMLVKAR